LWARRFHCLERFLNANLRLGFEPPETVLNKFPVDLDNFHFKVLAHLYDTDGLAFFVISAATVSFGMPSSDSLDDPRMLSHIYFVRRQKDNRKLILWVSARVYSLEAKGKLYRSRSCDSR